MQGQAVATQWHQCDPPKAGAPAEGDSQGAGEGAYCRSQKTHGVEVLCMILEGTELRFPDGQVLIRCKKL